MYIQKIKHFFKQKTRVVGVALVAIVAILIILIGGNRSEAETVIAKRQSVIENVSIVGNVEAGIVADLGFPVSGILRSVSAQVNQVVNTGTVLMSLDLGTLPSELAVKNANLTIAKAEADNDVVNLEAIEEEQNALVASAYATLLSDDLIAEAESESYGVTAPTITGNYSGQEGTYKIQIKAKTNAQDTFLLSTFDLEKTDPIEIKETAPTALGTNGLFINFPDSMSEYEDTTWYVAIPNTSSASYSSNFNFYQEALSTRTRVLEDAEALIREDTMGSSISAANLAIAIAEVKGVEAKIRERVLTAPFKGIVTAVNSDLGESVGANQIVLSLISEDDLGIEIDLPEIDSIKVLVGDSATVTLDAFGEGVEFPAKVIQVNRAETIVDGVPVYEARLMFDIKDERIASGMTAEVHIITDMREDVIAIPVRAVQTRADQSSYVVVMKEDEEMTEIEISMGLKGSDGFVEITQGLSEGDVVIIPK